MRRSLVLGWGLTGVLAAESSAIAQFAADRTAPQPPTQPKPAVPFGLEPAPPTPAPRVVPAVAALPAAEPEAPPSPWAVRPEAGEWLICVKSYAGPQARQHAEELAADIRAAHKWPVFLFERGGDERRKEEQRRQLIRQVQAEREAPFIALREQMRQKAEAEGRDFDATPATIKVPKIDIPEQWAVLVGSGFKTLDSTKDALAAVRRWPAPVGKPHLLDQAAVAVAGQSEAEAAYLNPFASAMAVRNPTVGRADAGQPPPIDPGLKKWNEKEEYNLLKCPKKYTLIVKQFSVPIRTQPKDGEAGMFDRLFRGSKTGEYLEATAHQAHSLAKSLRDPNMRPHPFETYVLHVKTGSLVTVGGYDDVDDPELLRVQRVLSAMTFEMLDERRMPAGTQKMFDAVYPFPIPKAQ
jgi:hypothetical protein